MALPVVAHDWGGQTDFLYAPKKEKKGKTKMRPHFVKVPYKLEQIQKEAIWDGVLQADSRWAFVSPAGAKVAIRDVYKNYSLHKGQAKRLQKWVKENFTEEKQIERFLDCLNVDYEIDEEIEKLFNELEL